MLSSKSTETTRIVDHNCTSLHFRENTSCNIGLWDWFYKYLIFTTPMYVWVCQFVYLCICIFCISIDACLIKCVSTYCSCPSCINMHVSRITGNNIDNMTADVCFLPCANILCTFFSIWKSVNFFFIRMSFLITTSTDYYHNSLVSC